MYYGISNRKLFIENIELYKALKFTLLLSLFQIKTFLLREGGGGKYYPICLKIVKKSLFKPL